MTRSFIEIPLFTKRWKQIGAGDEELQELQSIILANPKVGPVIEGAGGIRKMRFAFDHRGKRGSIRVCYLDFGEYGLTYLITAFKKNEQQNITEAEKNNLKKLVKVLRDEIANSNRR